MEGLPDTVEDTADEAEKADTELAEMENRQRILTKMSTVQRRIFNKKPTLRILTMKKRQSLTKGVADQVDIVVPHGASNQLENLPESQFAKPGDFMYIQPPAGGTVPHVVIVSAVDNNGKATTIIEADFGVDSREGSPPDDYFKRGHVYLDPN